jgi:hypothetical protein
MLGADVRPDAPVFDADPFSDALLADPYPFHAQVREAAPLIWLPLHDCYATARHGVVHRVLGDWRTFVSSAGVGVVNLKKETAFRPYGRSPLLEIDPPEHDVNRAVLNRVVSPQAIRAMREDFKVKAEALADELVARKEIDAVKDLAARYPLSVLPDAVGMEVEGREKLLPIAEVSFNSFGPKNALFRKSEIEAAKVVSWAARQCDRDVLSPTGLGAEIYKAHDEGKISAEIAAQLIKSFVVAGLDTTVNGLGNAIHGFARHPEQWEALRQDATLRKYAFDEIIRWDSPVQIYFRTTSCDVEIDGQAIPEGSKILLFIGGANRDPRQWDEPEKLNLRRRAMGHLSFGHGVHACVGQMIARLEAELIFEALANRVSRFELIGPVERKLNNTLRGFASLPVRLH